MPCWYRCFVYITVTSLLANCVPVPVEKRDTNTVSTSNDDHDYFEGDIRVRSVIQKRMIMQDESKKNMTEGDEINPKEISGGLWPDGIVYYKMDPNIANSLGKTFGEAMDIWSLFTCVQFVRLADNDNSHQAYLNLTDTQGCSSFIGRMGTMQEVSITQTCNQIGHALHELGHAIGLWHEHTRSDRNKYIRVVWGNIKSGYGHNFLKYDHPNVPKNIEYDYESLMHYKKDAFAVDSNRDTIEVIYKPLPTCLRTMGLRKDALPSFKDALRVNKMYNCTEKLNSNKTDPCSLPPPLPIVPTPASISSSPSPLPTTSTAVTPTPSPCKVAKSLLSTNQTRFHLTENDKYGLGCSSGICEREECKSIFRYHKCKSQYFVMYLASNRKNKHIKNGDTIALKSLGRRDHWLDCSRGNCTLTQCSDNTGKSITNFTRDICIQHKVKIFAVEKRLGKRIQTTDLIYFQELDSERYLNCYGSGHRCRFISETSDCDEMESSGVSGSLCTRQLFKIERYVEGCTL